MAAIEIFLFVELFILTFNNEVRGSVYIRVLFLRRKLTLLLLKYDEANRN